MNDNLSSVDVFDAVARGRLTPERGSDILRGLERSTLTPSRPKWLPLPVFVVLAVVFGLVVGHFGIQRDSKA